MALPSETVTLNNIAVSVWQSKLRDFVTDNFFGVIPLFEKLYLNDGGEGSVIRFEGGREIASTILYNAPTTTSYGPGSTADPSIVQIITDLIFQWKQVWTPINLDGLSLAKLAGGPETKLIDYVEKLGEAAFQSHANKIDTMIQSDGTGNSSLDWDGLLGAINTSANYATYGGITRSATSSDGTPGGGIVGYLNSTGGPMGKAILESAYVQTAYNKYMVDLIVTTRTLFGKLWEHVEGADRNAPGPLRDVGFQTIRFNGAEVVYDDNVTAGVVWGLNTKMLQMWFLSGNAFIRRSSQYGFTDTGFPVANQDMTLDQLISYGNFIVVGPKYCFQIQNCT
jgi:hypothetical protein